MSRKILAIFICLALSWAVNSGSVRYDNYRVYKVTPHSAGELELLNQLEASTDSLRFLDGVDAINKDVNIVVAPHKELDFVEVLQKSSMQFELIDENLQRHLDAENAALEATPYAGGYEWNRYHSLDETYIWLRGLAKKYPNQVQIVVGGKTYEGRDILGVKVSFKSGNPGIFVEGGIHAREWIAPATVTYILNALLTSTNSAVRDIAENYDWYIFPHANPDGYVHTMKGDRLWRKTRSRNGMCFGADPNRNWDFHWNEIGSSSNPCSDIFAGSAAFSEIETRSFSDYIRTLKGKFRLYLSFHAFSQLLLFPYGHTKEHAPNHNDMQRIGDVAANALARRYGTKYIVGNIYEAIYPASGASIEWAYGKLDIPLVYTYELRPRNVWNGFLLPADQIIPTSEETLDSVVALVNEAKNLGYFK